MGMGRAVRYPSPGPVRYESSLSEAALATAQQSSPWPLDARSPSLESDTEVPEVRRAS